MGKGIEAVLSMSAFPTQLLCWPLAGVFSNTLTTKEKFLLVISTLLVLANTVLWFWNWSNENWNSKGSRKSIWKINLLIRSFHKWIFKKTVGKYLLQNSSPTKIQHLWHCSELSFRKHEHIPLQWKTWFWSSKKRFKVILKIWKLRKHVNKPHSMFA